MKPSKGVIYILTNPSFPDYVKIGYATNIELRLQQLNRSETIPFAFRVYAIYEVEQELTDKKLHKLIDALNPELRSIEEFDGKKRAKEFYAMSAEDAYELLDCIAQISGTSARLKRMKPEGHEVKDEKVAKEIAEARRGAFRFSECNIPFGSKLQFVDDEKIEVVVVDDRHINYNGTITSVSSLAQQLKGFNHPVQGTLWFSYKGEKLADLRLRLEKEGCK